MFYDILTSTDDKTLYVSRAVMVIVLAGSYVTLFGFGVSGVHSGYRCSLGEMMWLLLTWKSFVRAIFGRGYCTYKRKETLVVRIKISIYYMTPLLASPCIFTNFYFKIHSQVIRVFFKYHHGYLVDRCVKENIKLQFGLCHLEAPQTWKGT